MALNFIGAAGVAHYTFFISRGVNFRYGDSDFLQGFLNIYNSAQV